MRPLNSFSLLAIVFTAAVLLAVARPTIAQTVPAVGTPATLDVATWNIEFFGRVGAGPGNEPLQFANVLAVLRGGAVDLWGLQEITDAPTFARLLDSLAGSGYAGFLGPAVNPDPMFDQRLAFVYNPAAITIQGSPTTILGGGNFGGRAPFEMRATVVLGDTSVAVRFIVLHAKAGSTQTDYNQRTNGASQLKAYIDPLIAAGEHIIVLGDFNDELGDSIMPGTQVSPYIVFTTDPDYLFTTLPLDQGNIPTWCGSNVACTTGSTLDHVMLTTPILDDYDGESNRFAELLDVFDAFGGEFVNTTSDHLPVWARLDLGGSATPNEPNAPAHTITLESPEPNPASVRFRVAFALDRAAHVRVSVFDPLGRRVTELAHGERPAGRHEVAMEAYSLQPGVYVIRLEADGETAARVLTVR